MSHESSASTRSDPGVLARVTAGGRSAADRLPAPLIFMASSLSQYLGAGLAVSLFSLMPSMTVAWGRLVVGAAVLVALRRPWRRVWTRRALLVAAAFGVATATMNVIFYAAISLLPLGTTVSLEFLGPVAVALVTGRGWRPRVAATLALLGVASISGLGVNLDDPDQRIGVLLALGAGVAWAAYILLGRRVASAGAGTDSLAVGMVAGALVYAPLAMGTADAILASPTAAVTVLGVGVLSTAVPYGLEQVVLRRLGTDAFALLSSLMPAASLLVGVVVLRQLPNAWEMIGLVLVSVAVALTAGTSGRVPFPPSRARG
jgi:integral membrane protein